MYNKNGTSQWIIPEYLDMCLWLVNKTLYKKKPSINLDIAMEWYIIPENVDMSFW